MQYNQLLIEEKRKLLTIMERKYVKLNFSKMVSIFENNLKNPRWMDIYILIYKCNLPQDIKAYDILLKKLSMPLMRFYFKDGDKRYIANVNERMISRYVWYLITKDMSEYYIETQFIPKKDYINRYIIIERG